MPVRKPELLATKAQDPLAIGRTPITVYVDAQLYARLQKIAGNCGACIQGYAIGAVRLKVERDEQLLAASAVKAAAPTRTP
jgi:hypothetical protein